ncbi:NAD(P)-dependent oxidoreductase [Streptomyces sp. NPDC002851]
MAGVLVLTGATDVPALRAAVPSTQVVEAPHPRAARHVCDDISVLILRSGVHIGAEELDALPRLRHVVRTGSGIDNIDVRALEDRGVRLHRNASASAPAVAEWALASALALSRRIPLGNSALMNGTHDKAACLSAPLGEMTVGIWGAGPVGLAAGHALAPHVAGVVYVQWPSNPPWVDELPADTLLDRCKLHVIALPLRPRTRHIIGTDFLTGTAARLPHVICAGRLETLDTTACLRALADGRLSGLAVDAVERAHLPLLRDLPTPMNLLVTPHIGAQRRDVREQLDCWTAGLVRDLLEPTVTTAAGGGAR